MRDVAKVGSALSRLIGCVNVLSGVKSGWRESVKRRNSEDLSWLHPAVGQATLGPSRSGRGQGGRSRSLASVWTMQDLDATVTAGLPKRALIRLSARLYHDQRLARAFKSKVIPPAMVKRHWKRLSRRQSEYTERLDRVRQRLGPPLLPLSEPSPRRQRSSGDAEHQASGIAFPTAADSRKRVALWPSGRPRSAENGRGRGKLGRRLTNDICGGGAGQR